MAATPRKRSAKTPANQRPPEAPPAAVEVPGFWDLRIAPALAKLSLPLALCLIAIACARITSTYSQLSLTTDEPIHFACGLEYLAKHIYKLEPQHPPLSRAMVALGPYLDGLRPSGATEMSEEGYAVLGRAGDVDHEVFLMRLGILPFFVMACLVLYWWTVREFGKPAAVLALALFTLEPTVLAHAGLATTDMALTACVASSFFALTLWAETPTWKYCLLLAITTSMAVLSKFTTLGYLPAAAVLALVFYIVAQRPGLSQLLALAKARLVSFAVALVLVMLAVWAGYWFSFGNVPGWNIRLPAPEFFDGVLFAMHHNAGGHQSYLLGQFGGTGWWYFFLVALAVKTPIALLLFFAVGAWVCWRRGGTFGLTPAAFALGILLPAMTSHVNIGLRHVLPVYFGICMIGAVGFLHLARSIRKPALAVGFPALLLVWMAVSGARQHPDYLAYFNAFAGDEPDRVMVDSDLDWGQGVKFLSRRLRELGATHVSVLFLQPGRFAEFYQKAYHLPPIVPFSPLIPNEGWNVVSPTIVREIAGTPEELHPTQANIEVRGSVYFVNSPWYERMQPTERVRELLLYKIPPNFVPQ